MIAGGTFIWHEAAQLFAGAQRIARPTLTNTCGFRSIAATPSVTSLPQLASALVDKAPFCLHDLPLPELIAPNPGAFLTLTGGASGKAKVICRTQASWIASFEINADLFDLTPHDKTALLGQLSHSLALYGLLEALHLGLDAHLFDALTPARQWAALEQEHINILYLTPTQMRLLCRAAKGRVNRDLRLVLCGGGMFDQDTRAAARQAFPEARVHEFYGAAETSFITISDDDTPAGSVGKAYPGVALQIRDAAGQTTDEAGEVWVNSPYLFAGYAAGHSKETRQDRGCITVGEIGHLDDKGHLWLRGRRSRMVTIADQNVFVEEVEQEILALAEVESCAVLSVIDPLRGHRLVAILPGDQDVTLAEKIQQHCRVKLGALAAPHRVLFRDHLPLLPSGKTDLQALARWLESVS